MTQSTNDPAVWFVRVGENTFGPYPLRRVRAFITEGRIRSHTRVRIGEGGEFTSAAESPVLGPLLTLGRGRADDAPKPNTAARDRGIARAAERLVNAVAPEPRPAAPAEKPVAEQPAPVQPEPEPEPASSIGADEPEADTGDAPGEMSAETPMAEPVDSPANDSQEDDDADNHTSPSEAAKRIQALLEAHVQEDLPLVAGSSISSLSMPIAETGDVTEAAFTEEPAIAAPVVESAEAVDEDELAVASDAFADSDGDDEIAVEFTEAPDVPSPDEAVPNALEEIEPAQDSRKRGAASPAVAFAASLEYDFDDEDSAEANNGVTDINDAIDIEVDLSSPPEAPIPSPPAVGDDASSLLVVAQLRTTSEAAIEGVLAQFGPTAKASPGVWFVRALASCDELRNAITRKLGGRDTLIIVDTSNDEAAWFNIGADRDNAIRVLRDKATEAAA